MPQMVCLVCLSAHVDKILPSSQLINTSLREDMKDNERFHNVPEQKKSPYQVHK